MSITINHDTNDISATSGSVTIGGSPVGGSSSNVQTFNESGTWTKPASANFVLVEAWGGGGGGGGGAGYTYGSTTTSGSSGGGGAGYSSKTFLASSLPSTVTVTVGAGGTGGTGATSSSTGGGNGGNGGTSSFGSFLQGFGGGGGVSSSTGSYGQGGGIFSAGSTTAPGRPAAVSGSAGHFGAGAASNPTAFPEGSGWGGGNGSIASGNGGLSSLYGGGGGGGSSSRSAGVPTPSGSPGGYCGNFNVSTTWPSSTILGGAGIAAPTAGSGGYGGNSGVFDGSGYATIVKYGSFYFAPTQLASVRGSNPLGSGLYTNIARSSDGVTWSLINTNVKIYAVFIGIDNNLYGVSTTQPNSAGTTTLSSKNSWDYYTSTDGQTWTYVSTLTNATAIQSPIPAIVNGYYVIHIGSNTTTYVYSNNLTSWTSGTLIGSPNRVNSDFFGNSQQICFCGGEYFAVGGGSTSTTNLQVASSIGGPWTYRTTGINSGIQTLTTNGTRLLAQFTGTSPYIYYSDTNGGAWTIATGTLTGITANKLSTFSYNGTFYFGSYLSNLYYSSDGITWSTATDNTTDSYAYVLFADNKYTITSSSASSIVCIYATTPSSTWTSATLTQYITGGAGGAGATPGGGGGAGGIGSTGGAGGAGGTGLVRITSW